MKTKILVIGGDRITSLEQKAERRKFEIVHHTARIKQKDSKRRMERMVREADCIILFPDACSHRSMWDVRDLSKQYGKPIVYPKGLGATQALQKAYQVLTQGTAGHAEPVFLAN